MSDRRRNPFVDDMADDDDDQAEDNEEEEEDGDDDLDGFIVNEDDEDDDGGQCVEPRNEEEKNGKDDNGSDEDDPDEVERQQTPPYYHNSAGDEEEPEENDGVGSGDEENSEEAVYEAISGANFSFNYGNIDPVTLARMCRCAVSDMADFVSLTGQREQVMGLIMAGDSHDENNSPTPNEPREIAQDFLGVHDDRAFNELCYLSLVSHVPLPCIYVYRYLLLAVERYIERDQQRNASASARASRAPSRQKQRHKGGDSIDGESEADDARGGEGGSSSSDEGDEDAVYDVHETPTEYIPHEFRSADIRFIVDISIRLSTPTSKQHMYAYLFAFVDQGNVLRTLYGENADAPSPLEREMDAFRERQGAAGAEANADHGASASDGDADERAWMLEPVAGTDGPPMFDCGDSDAGGEEIAGGDEEDEEEDEDPEDGGPPVSARLHGTNAAFQGAMADVTPDAITFIFYRAMSFFDNVRNVSVRSMDYDAFMDINNPHRDGQVMQDRWLQWSNRLKVFRVNADNTLLCLQPSDKILQDPALEKTKSYFDYFDATKMDGNQLFLDIAAILFKERLSKDEAGRVTERIYRNNLFTYSYRVRYEDISKAVYDTHSITKNPDIFPKLDMAGGRLNSIVNKFEGYNNSWHHFPQIKRERTFMSFRDGVLDLMNMNFVPLSDIEWALPNATCSCVYHDLPMGKMFRFVAQDLYPVHAEASGSGGYAGAFSYAEARSMFKKLTRARNKKGELLAIRNDVDDREELRLKEEIYRKLRKEAEECLRVMQELEQSGHSTEFALGEDLRRLEEDVNAKVKAELGKASVRQLLKDRKTKAYEEKKAAFLRTYNRVFSSEEERRRYEEFEPYQKKRYMEIPTPAFDKMIYTQLCEPQTLPGGRFSYEPPGPKQKAEYRMILALLGRMFFEVGPRALDRWDIMPWIAGTAATGKSGIIKLMRACYGKGDTATMNNNAEETFGQSNLRKAYIVLGAEIGTGFRLPMKQWLSMVVGEDVSTPVKNKEPIDGPWTQPMLFMGNGMPLWIDNQGQVSRRILFIVYRTEIPNEAKDPHLHDRLMKERHAFILKATCAYHDLRYTLGKHRTIWDKDVMPQMFVDNRISLEVRMNPLIAFLEDRQYVTIGAGHQTQRRYFDKAFQEYLDIRKFKYMGSEEDYDVAFKRYGIKVDRTQAEVLHGLHLENQQQPHHTQHALGGFPVT